MPPLPDTASILLRSGLVDAVQLESARGHQHRWGHTLERAVIELGFVAEDTVFGVLAAAAGVEYVPAGELHAPAELLRRVPEKLVRSLQVLPVALRPGRGRGTLVVAMADPLDLAAVDEISFATGMAVKPVLASAYRLEEAIARHLDVASPGPGSATGDAHARE